MSQQPTTPKKTWHPKILSGEAHDYPKVYKFTSEDFSKASWHPKVKQPRSIAPIIETARKLTTNK